MLFRLLLKDSREPTERPPSNNHFVAGFEVVVHFDEAFTIQTGLNEGDDRVIKDGRLIPKLDDAVNSSGVIRLMKGGVVIQPGEDVTREQGFDDAGRFLR